MWIDSWVRRGSSTSPARNSKPLSTSAAAVRILLHASAGFVLVTTCQPHWRYTLLHHPDARNGRTRHTHCLLVVLSRSTPLPPAARLSIPSASSRPANPMSTATAALAAARSPAVALLSLRRRAHAAAPIRFPGLRVGSGCRHVAMASAAHARAPTDPLPKGADSFFRAVISNMEKVYLSRNPTAKTILELVRSYDGDHICYDHLAFRTFGVNGYGINSLSEFFTDFGYVPREELRFPAKNLRALWFSPPTNGGYSGTGTYGPLPRIFISELLVDELTTQSQEIIHKYIKTSGNGNNHAALSSTSGELTWEKPIYSDFQILSSESEYAAWTLVNGYALNHATIATHRLESDIRNINKFNKFVEDNGFKLNSEGGILKVSPDGLLQQSSTVADSSLFTFADGITESIPRSYIEFAERLLLPQFKDLQDEEVKEYHRRDGFEVGNADKIFESTSRDQLTRTSA